jgi:hypothetical protein
MGETPQRHNVGGAVRHAGIAECGRSAGIVNAVQNGKIGGDLRFISPQGIAVSSTGVINAGQVGMVVPTDKYYQELLGNETLLKSADLLSAKSIQNGEVPLNLAGTITVAGHINTVGGITLAAANIDLKEGALLNSQKLIKVKTQPAPLWSNPIWRGLKFYKLS